MAGQHSDSVVYVSPSYGSGSKSRTCGNAPGNNSHLERTENTKSEVRTPSGLNLICKFKTYGVISYVYFFNFLNLNIYK